jgi:hypothetical protein
MLVWETHGAPRPVGLAMWRAICSVSTSYWVIASAIHTLVRSAARRCTVVWLCSRLPARFAGHNYIVCPHILQAHR